MCLARVNVAVRSGGIALLLMAIPQFAAAPPAHAASPGPAAASSSREAATRAQLAEVRAEIAKLVEEQHAAATQRDAINAKLAQQAAQLDDAAKALRAADAAIAARTAALADLQTQRAQLEARLAGQREALAELLRAVYTLDRGSELPLLLGDNDLARIDRALAYSRYFQRDRVGRIRGLLGEVAQLDAIRSSIEAEAQAMQRQRDERATRSAALEQQRDAQKKLLAEADARLAQQKGKLASLKHDAEALARLLKQLQDVFADIPAQLGKSAPFAKLRGKLAWPVAGAPREGTGLLANGVVIAAEPGSDVHAVAYGRVAWADFMRGYGMLVIIDHGGGWMSLYGGNESALVSAGDWVRPGQPVATVGRDPEQGGAWFGLRKDGKPVDPQGWFASRR
ncbi:MAG TPA: peptidoglycan DD-metalloendopeptidase family protein [Rhodanobacteraceae bacterium]|nr:peptidoglycan DD-metalloendopeptidase family protein [Rhodanobacteraceae bacterium]